MKKVLWGLVLLGMLAGPSRAGNSIGSAFGTLTTAQAQGRGVGTLGFGVGFGDAVSFVSSFEYGISRYTDIRIKLGLVDQDFSDTQVMIGSDIQWQMWTHGDSLGGNQPFDLAFGAFMEFADYDFGSVFQLGAQAIGSYPFRLNNGHDLSPYARLGARLESFGTGSGAYGQSSETKLRLGFNAGLQWQLSAATSFYFEAQLDGNDGVFFGMDLSVL